ncbi:alpha/beta hydrolase [Methanobrevibacter sp. OttesenSCG-928-I08]|nr:alpha/beta hydrolase [Methanobrevibacter sp. OttesenSCG-928-I08]
MKNENIDHLKMNYKIEGKGFPIVLIHGLSDDLNYWNVISSKIKNNFKIISLDLRGHGKTDIGETPISIPLFTEDVYNLLDYLNISKCHVIGFSLGGNVAIELALTHPNLVTSLVLISTYVKADKNLKKCFIDLKNALKKGPEEYIDTIMPYVLPKDIIALNKNELDNIKREKSEIFDCENLIKAIEAGETFNREESLENIKCKTLIITSKNDDLTSPELSYNLYEKIPNSKLEILDYGKHNVFIDKNIDYLNGLILEFLLSYKSNE